MTTEKEMFTTREEKFNKAFNIFILVGMMVAVSVATVFKMRGSDVRILMQTIASLSVITGVINTILSANGNRWTFVFGFVDVLLGTFVYLDSGLMGNFALHAFYFLPMNVIGWWQWSKRTGKNEKKLQERVRPRVMTGRQRILLGLGLVASTVAAYFVLRFVDAKRGVSELDNMKLTLDAAVFMCNIVGQILMSYAFYEQWIIWNLVNICSVCMWTRVIVSDPGAGYTIVMLIKYVFYLLNSINGLRIWTRLAKENRP